MFRLISFLALFSTFTSFGQLIIEDRSGFEKFESQALYVQMAPGTLAGDLEIEGDRVDDLSNYPELKGLFLQGDLVQMQLEFKALAKMNEAFNRIYRLKTASGVDLDALVNQLERLDYISISEKIPLYELSFVPNDPDYSDASKRWHLDRVNAEQAWDITQGCANIKIAIVDDAVMLNHEDLQSKIFTNVFEVPGNGIDDDGNGYIDDVNGFDVADNDANASPPSTATSSYFSHGTHVAGIAAGASNNGQGTSSLGFNTSILPVKVKSNSSTSNSALTNPMQGVEYAIVMGADVINMSWGSYAHSSINQMVFDQANILGIMCVAAVGNDALPFIAYPANYNGVISVVATDLSDDIAFFSNFTQERHVFAPGVNIWSAEAVSTSSYGFKSGTSMATPLTSGLIALMLCTNPNYSLYDIEYCLHYNSDMISSTAYPGNTIARMNAQQTLMCTLPINNECQAVGCEMIENGSMEVPSYSNLTTYDDFGGIYYGELCGWDNYPKTADIFPLNTNAPDHYAHLQCNIQNGFEVYEGLVTKNPLDLVPGMTYRLDFDYSVMKDQDLSPITDHLDSIVIRLVSNNWTQPPGVYTIESPNVVIGQILDPMVDHVHLGWVAWLDQNAPAPDSAFNHYSMTFVAPNDPTLRKLVIHPVSDYPTLGFSGTLGLGLDNISLRPVTEVTGTSSNYTPQPNDCITLTATTPANYVYWEPAHLFADPTLPVQNICLDTLETCPGGQIQFTVTAMDTAIGCSSSDTITLDIQGTDVAAPTPNEPALDPVENCSSVNYIVPPTAWDNCDGAITGVPDVAFPITGSTTVTWGFTDSHGNTATQQQTVTISTIDVSLTIDGMTMTAEQSGAQYQWINCNTGSPIPGATNQSYTPATGGSYAVIITNGSCVDTSACINDLGLDETFIGSNIVILPNPTSEKVSIEYAAGIILGAEVYDAGGKLILSVENEASTIQLDFSPFARGSYLTRIRTEHGVVSRRIVRQ